MPDWQKTALAVLGYALLTVLAAGIAFTVYQGWADGLVSRWVTTGGALAIAALSALLWRRLPLASRVHLLLAYLIVLIGGIALWYTPEAKDVFRIGGLSLAFLVNAIILLSLTVSLFFLLRALGLSWKPSVAIGAFGALCAVPYLIGLIRDISLANLLQGEGFLPFLPWFIQPATLGVLLLLPILLFFLLVDFFRSFRAEGRSPFRTGLNLLSAAVPVAIGAMAILGQPSAGIVQRVYDGHSFATLLSEEVVSDTELVWESPPSGAGPVFWVELEGRLRASEEGDYEFRMDGDGSGFLFVDGERVIAQGGTTGAVHLSAGQHRFRSSMLSEQASGRHALQWARPEDEGFAPIDGQFLGHGPSQIGWRRTPRQAAQVGVEWLQSASVDWQRSHKCFGCHVQAQVLMGLSVARDNRYRVSQRYFEELREFTREIQAKDGTYHSGSPITATQFATMGLAFADQQTGSGDDPAFQRAVSWLIGKQTAEGEVPIDHREAPIDQGSIMTTANSVIAFDHAHRTQGEDRYRDAATRAFRWLGEADAQTTQDKVMKILATSRFGDSSDRRKSAPVMESLLSEQGPDGGWKETPRMSGSNAYATGQVLYALKQAGVSVNDPAFRRGVRFLLENQKVNGVWPSMNTQTHRKSEFAPTMWAVIGLAGSFGEIIPEFLAPDDAATVDGPVALQAEVTNFTDSEIVSVVFELDGTRLGDARLEEEKWVLEWRADGIADGEHELRVVAKNVEGTTGAATRLIFSGAGVRIAFESPEDGAVLGDRLTLVAMAEGLFGETVESVSFLVADEALPEAKDAGEGRWSVEWESASVPPGRHRVTAVVVGSNGHEARASVSLLKRSPLTLRIQAPSDGDRVVGVATCRAKLEMDPTAPVERVEFLLDEDSLADAPGPGFEVPCDFSAVSPGGHELMAIARDAGGGTAFDSIHIQVGEDRGPGYLQVRLRNPEAGDDQVVYLSPANVELLLDMSNSMWGQIAGVAKVTIAREVLAELLNSFPADANLGVRVYGHRSKSNCEDTELLVPLGPVDPDAIMARVAALKPKGKTPIGYSLRQALEDVRSLETSTAIVLITDGVETCGGDPVKAAAELAEAGLKLRIHVVGFDIGESPEAVQQLQQVAENGGGEFFLAGSAEELGSALQEAVSVSYSVFDDQGERIFTKPLGLESNELLSGSYRIEIDVDPPLRYDVSIEKGKTSVIDVVKEGAEFRIEAPE